MLSSWKFGPLTSANELEVLSKIKSNQRVYTVKHDVCDPPSPCGRFDIPPPSTWTVKDDVVELEPARPVARGGSGGHRPHAALSPWESHSQIDQLLILYAVTLNYWHRRAASISAEISSLILAAAKFEFLKIELCTRVKVRLLIPSLRGFQANLKNNAGIRRGWLFEVLLRI